MSTPERLALQQMAEAVAAGAYRVEDEAGGSYDVGQPGGAMAVAVIDAALRAVEARQRVSRRAEPDEPLDPKVFGRQALVDLAQFLRHVRQGALTPQEIVEEARMWRQLVLAGWPPEARDAGPVGAAIELLSSLPDAEPEPKPLLHVEPPNDLEQALVALHQEGDGATSRARLWQALHDGELVLPVVGYELLRPDGPMLRFLAAPLAGGAVIYGFTSDERFAAILGDPAPVGRATPPGRDLARFWPEHHGLMVNPGYDDHVMLSPQEIATLPHGPKPPGEL